MFDDQIVFFFPDSRLLLQGSSLMLLYGLWSRGTSYYATHVGTMVCCYGDCQGSWGIIGVYPRQEQGYSPSIRTHFNLAAQFGPHIRINTVKPGQRRNTAENTAQRRCDLADRSFRHSYSWKKDLVQTPSWSCWFKTSLQSLFLDRTACEQNKANRIRGERLEEGVKMEESIREMCKDKIKETIV